MRISFVSLFYPSDVGTPDEHLRRFPLLNRLPAEMAARGHDVEHVSLFPTAATIDSGTVLRRFVAAPRLLRLAARGLARVTRRPPPLFEIVAALSDAVARHHPEIVHVFGTQLHLGLAQLRHRIPGGRLVLHYHGGYPPRNSLARRLQKRNVAASRAVLFTARSQADPFVEADVLEDPEKVYELVETSSRFEPDASAPRLEGGPAFVSACRLHPVKDPMTTLKGFERILETHPEACLHHFYLTDELLPELRRYTESRPAMRRRVFFHGARSYDEMEIVFNGADVLMQASVREFSGCAVLDAMACGAVPVVSDIPPHRRIVGDAGALFKPGDPDALADRVRKLGDLRVRGAAARERFERELSFSAMARQLEGVYLDLMDDGDA